MTLKKQMADAYADKLFDRRTHPRQWLDTVDTFIDAFDAALDLAIERTPWIEFETLLTAIKKEKIAS